MSLGSMTESFGLIWTVLKTVMTEEHRRKATAVLLGASRLDDFSIVDPEEQTFLTMWV